MTFENTPSAHIDFNSRVPYISFPALSAISFLRHGFSTKFGGVSTGFFSSMNLGSESLPYQDDPENIKENYCRIADSIGFDVHSVVVSLQVHKTNIKVVEKVDCGKGLFDPRDYDEIDGLITNKPNITLVTKYADCVPLYFVDPVKKAIGLSHSGWRGTVAKIGRITVEAMNMNYGSDPKDLIAVIGPSICAGCYEVGEETAEEFRKAFPMNWGSILLETNRSKLASDDNIQILKGNQNKSDINRDANILKNSCCDPGINENNYDKSRNDKYQCDLWEANRIVLEEAGLRPNNIHVSGVCTSCNSDILFSHRKTQGKRGSLAAFLMMTE